MRSKIPQICEVLHQINNQKIVLTAAFIQKAKNRKFQEGKVKKIIQEKNIVGVFDQDDDSFRVWFQEDQNYDTCVPLRLEADGKIYPITIYPTEKQRRIRFKES